MSVSVVKEYNAHIDAKKRITLRGTEAEYYSVKMFNDGRIMLEPRILVPLEAVSKRILDMLDKSAVNLKNGKLSNPIDLDKYL